MPRQSSSDDDELDLFVPGLIVQLQLLQLFPAQRIVEDENDSTNVIDSMPVGVVSMKPVEMPGNERWQKWYPLWLNAQIEPRDEIGNCYEMTAEYLLTIMQPYPGDNLKSRRCCPCDPEDRFTVKQELRNMKKF